MDANIGYNKSAQCIKERKKGAKWINAKEKKKTCVNWKFKKLQKVTIFYFVQIKRMEFGAHVAQTNHKNVILKNDNYNKLFYMLIACITCMILHIFLRLKTVLFHLTNEKITTFQLKINCWSLETFTMHTNHHSCWIKMIIVILFSKITHIEQRKKRNS